MQAWQGDDAAMWSVLNPLSPIAESAIEDWQQTELDLFFGMDYNGTKNYINDNSREPYASMMMLSISEEDLDALVVRLGLATSHALTYSEVDKYMTNSGSSKYSLLVYYGSPKQFDIIKGFKHGN